MPFLVAMQPGAKDGAPAGHEKGGEQGEEKFDQNELEENAFLLRLEVELWMQQDEASLDKV